MRRLRCTLLCEDREQEKFFRRLIEQRFHLAEPIRVERGGGVAFVRRYLSQNVRIVRQFPQQAKGLVVAIDGDTAGKERRIRELNELLVEEGMARLSEAEKIAVCVPTRTIETWEVWLCDRLEVDESRDYKGTVGPQHAKRAAAAWLTSQSDEHSRFETAHLPSLKDARIQIERLVRLGNLL